jgi:hypothetical protein
MDITVFMNVTPCSLVSVYYRFRLTFCLQDAAGSSETSVTEYQTTRRDVTRVIFIVTCCEIAVIS